MAILSGNKITASDVIDYADNKVFTAVYGTTTFAEIKAAYDSGAIVLCTRSDNSVKYILTGLTSTTAYFVGTGTSSQILYRVYVDSTWHAASFTCASSSHNQSASTITSGTLPIERGGTGVTSLEALKNLLGIAEPEMQPWNISKNETNDGKTTYVYFNTADTTIKQFEIYFSDTPTYKYFSSNEYYNGNWKAADSVKLAADGGSTLIFDNRGAKYFKTSGGRLYLQFEDDDLGGCTLVMNLIVYIYR